MRATIVRIGVTGAGALLALGLLAAPPAGADGSTRQNKGEQSGKVTCFNAEGHTQGRSLSDPDGDTNGGADKPGCTRVAPWDADKDNDGNNGCGNDADREDDNNGNCGHQKTEAGNAADEQASGNGATVTPEKVDADVTVQAAGPEQAAGVPAAEASTTTAAPTTVLGSAATAPAGAEATTTPAAPGTQVLGETLSRPGTLARTGAGIGGLALLGGLLCGGGRLTVLARRLLRIG
jgi:hypothetical protein